MSSVKVHYGSLYARSGLNAALRRLNAELHESRALGGGGIQPVEVSFHPFFDGSHCLVEARGPHLGHVSPGKALIASLHVLGKGNVFDFAMSVPCDHGAGDGVKCLGAPCTQVEYFRLLRSIQKPKVGVDGIANVNEITLLFFVVVPIRPLEQSHAARLANLIVKVVCNAGHAALMLLAGSVNIEVSETHDLAF